MDFSPLGWIGLTFAIAFGAIKFFGKTYLEVTIKGTFAQDLEKFKSDLTLEVADRIEPFKTGLAILASRHGVIFDLEKESIVEFTGALNHWLWNEMGIKMDMKLLQDSEKIRSAVNSTDKAYYQTRVSESKLDLIVENQELIRSATDA